MTNSALIGERIHLADAVHSFLCWVIQKVNKFEVFLANSSIKRLCQYDGVLLHN